MNGYLLRIKRVKNISSNEGSLFGSSSEGAKDKKRSKKDGYKLHDLT